MAEPEWRQWLTTYDREGFTIVPGVLDFSTVETCCRLIESARRQQNSENVSNRSGTYGLRNLTDVVPEITDLLQQSSLSELVESVLGADSFMVRATLFDKTPGANWGVFWHQDLSIAVEEKVDVEGFSAWTRKAGVQCVQPPLDLMRQVLAVRLHLDDCTAANGALKVLPGTHQLSSANIEDEQQNTAEVICEVGAGGAVLMNPLLLHASSPMEVESSRRVIHFEFASFDLPTPLQWKYRLPVGHPCGNG